MRHALTLFVAVVFALSLASAALAQGTQTAPPPAGSSGSTADPSKSATDPAKGTTPASPSTSGTTGKSGMEKSAAGKDKAGSSYSMRGMHRMTGEVTKVDAAKGTMSLKTAEGDMDLHFPPSALQGIKEGDRVEVQLAIRPAAAAGQMKNGTTGKTSASQPEGTAGAPPKSGKGGKTSTETGVQGQQPKTN
jgi:hypothetical protein